MRMAHALILCLALSGCKGCPSKTPANAPSDAGIGITPIEVKEVQPKPVDEDIKPGLVEEAHTAVALVAKGYAAIPTKARPIRPEDARARKGLAQAMSGIRYAVTGEGKLMLVPQSPPQLPPHTIVRSQVLGMNEASITLRVPNPGGTAAMATGRVMIGKVKPTAAHVQSARLNAIERIAKQSRGSGQIIPIASTAPRVEDGILLLEVNARVFRDGSP